MSYVPIEDSDITGRSEDPGTGDLRYNVHVVMQGYRVSKALSQRDFATEILIGGNLKTDRIGNPLIRGTPLRCLE
jgi:hypothetical protein